MNVRLGCYTSRRSGNFYWKGDPACQLLLEPGISIWLTLVFPDIHELDASLVSESSLPASSPIPKASSNSIAIGRRPTNIGTDLWVRFKIVGIDGTVPSSLKAQKSFLGTLNTSRKFSGSLFGGRINTASESTRLSGTRVKVSECIWPSWVRVCKTTALCSLSWLRNDIVAAPLLLRPKTTVLGFWTEDKPEDPISLSRIFPSGAFCFHTESSAFLDISWISTRELKTCCNSEVMLSTTNSFDSVTPWRKLPEEEKDRLLKHFWSKQTLYGRIS